MIIKINGNVLEVVGAPYSVPQVPETANVVAEVVGTADALATVDLMASVKDTVSTYVDAFFQFIQEALI